MTNALIVLYNKYQYRNGAIKMEKNFRTYLVATLLLGGMFATFLAVSTSDYKTAATEKGIDTTEMASDKILVKVGAGGLISMMAGALLSRTKNKER